jgi:hypothetical protein
MGLHIHSQSPEHRGQALFEHMLDGIRTIGVYGDEPFSIRFANQSPHAMQVKISLDGTDILSGQPANLDPKTQMWFVDAHQVMDLHAWPETTRGGARFIFSSVAQSVAVHTHGDLTARGYISAAIFAEGYTPPRYTVKGGGGTKSFDHLRGLTYESCGFKSAHSVPEPAIGAGEYVEQGLVETIGFKQPVFSSITQIRYLWWDDLVARLQAAGLGPQSQHPTGFGGRPLANLGQTPRIGATTSHPSYRRFY